MRDRDEKRQGARGKPDAFDIGVDYETEFTSSSRRSRSDHGRASKIILTAVFLVLIVAFAVAAVVMNRNWQNEYSPASIRQQVTLAVLPSAQPTLQPVSGHWRIGTETDPFTDKLTVILTLWAEESIQTWLSSTTPILYVRCKNDQLNVYIAVNTQIEDGGRDYQATARTRFDDLPSEDILMDTSDTGESLFFVSHSSALQNLRSHQRLVFGFTPFNAAFDSTTFDLTGLDTALATSEFGNYCAI